MKVRVFIMICRLSTQTLRTPKIRSFIQNLDYWEGDFAKLAVETTWSWQTVAWTRTHKPTSAWAAGRKVKKRS